MCNATPERGGVLDSLSAYALSDEDPACIKAEEIYRAEVRRSLEREMSVPKANGLSRRVFSFFNSAFGLWLLSTIVIGLVTFSYSKYNDARQVRVQKQLFEERLADEIGARVNDLASLVSPDVLFWPSTTQATIKNGSALEVVQRLDAYMEDPPDDYKTFPITNVFGEFRSQSLRDLLNASLSQSKSDREIALLLELANKSKVYYLGWALAHGKSQLEEDFAEPKHRHAFARLITRALNPWLATDQ